MHILYIYSEIRNLLSHRGREFPNSGQKALMLLFSAQIYGVCTLLDVDLRTINSQLKEVKLTAPYKHTLTVRGVFNYVWRCDIHMRCLFWCIMFMLSCTQRTCHPSPINWTSCSINVRLHKICFIVHVYIVRTSETITFSVVTVAIVAYTGTEICIYLTQVLYMKQFYITIKSALYTI